MRKLISLILSCGLLFTSGAWAADSMAARQAAEKEVRQTVADFSAAYGSTDVDKYFSFYADDFSFVGPTGWSTKQAYYSSWKPNVEGGGGVSSAQPTDIRVQVTPSADAAIASYQLKCVRRKPREGQDANVTYNFTVAWFKEGAKWKVHSLSFAVATPEAKGPVAASGKSN